MNDGAAAYMVGAGEGETLRYPRGGSMEIKASSGQTGGAYALLEFRIPPGGMGSPLHYHLETAEGFYVVEGALRFTAGGRTERLAAGAWVFVPAGVPHEFANATDGETRVLILVSPGAFEGYFRAMSKLALDSEGDPPREAVERVAASYGQLFVDTTDTATGGGSGGRGRGRGRSDRRRRLPR